MKKITMLMVALASFATISSCGDKDKPAPTPKDAISATPATLECEDTGGDKTFVLTASGDWTITGTPAFATVTPLTGAAGDKITITVTFKANETAVTLKGELKAALNSDPTKSTIIKLSSLGKGAKPENIDYANIQNYMVEVEGGTFEMSTEGVETNPKSDAIMAGEEFDPYHKRHNVTLDSYMICKYEMTQETWKRIMNTEPYVNGGTNHNPSTKPVSLKIEGGPVCYNLWIEAIEFCNKLSEDQQLEPYYKIEGNKASIIDLKGKGYRLPTESEWEYAARGGQMTQGFFYPGFQEDFDIEAFAWTETNSGKKVNTVGKLSPNELGLYDMAGNVWEQVWDWYDVYPTADVVNPVGPATGSETVMRGCSWFTASSVTFPFGSSVRNHVDRAFGDDDQGFRIARYK